MTIGSADKKGRTGQLWTANPVLSVKTRVAKRLWNGLFAFICCSSFLFLSQLALSAGWEPGADQPRQPPQAKVPVHMSPEILITFVSFLHSWFIFCEQNHRKGVCEWRKATHGLGGCCTCPSGQVHSVKLPSTPQLFIKPTVLLQKLPWLKKKKKISEHCKRLSLTKKQSKTCFL